MCGCMRYCSSKKWKGAAIEPASRARTTRCIRLCEAVVLPSSLFEKFENGGSWFWSPTRSRFEGLPPQNVEC